MACLCKKFNRKNVLITLGGVIGVGLIAIGIKTLTYEMKVSALKKTHSIKFDDIKKDYKNNTGLIDSEIEKVLNKAGVFDFEIKRLDESDINELKKCKNVTDISVEKEFYGINNDNRRGYEGYSYGFSLDELSGKEVLVQNRDFYSLSSIVYCIKDDGDKKVTDKKQNKSNKKKESKKDIEEKYIYKTITIATFYNMPEKLGHDMFVYSGDDRAIKNYNIARAYGVYDVSTYKDISATKVKKKENHVNVHIQHLTSKVIQGEVYQKILFITDRLFKYLDLEKISDWKTTYKDLRRKEIDFIKVNNASFIISVEQELKEEHKEDYIWVSVAHNHQVMNTRKMYDIPSTEKQVQKLYTILDSNKIGNQCCMYEDEEYDDEYIDDEIDWDESWKDIKSDEVHYID